MVWRMFWGKLKSGTWVVLAIFCVSLGVLGTGVAGYFLAAPGPLTEDKVLVIPPGSTLRDIRYKLDKYGIVAGVRRFDWTVRVLGFSESLQAGEYNFEAGISVRQVINKLVTGDTIRRNITIPEGLTVGQIATIFAEEEGITGDFPNNIQEGALYPDTYQYRHGQKVSDIVQKMQKRLVEALNTAWEQRDSDLPYATPTELLILASIIEKETARADERARIAGVFVNRLNKGMKLQSDPTVIYGASDYDGNLTTFHLREDQPYNTYVHTGLPPTPIANVGEHALMAAAQPEYHDYLFFVADGSGGHAFSETYEEHVKNVNKYIKIYKEAYGK